METFDRSMVKGFDHSLTESFTKGSSIAVSVAIVGLGYVGLPLARKFAFAGCKVTGIDINEQIVSSLASCRSTISSVTSDELIQMADTGFRASSAFCDIADANAVIVCVPTPLCEKREPDLSAVKNAFNLIAPHIRKGQILSFESTTWPGTTREVVVPILERSNLKAGEDFHVVYSPEREDPGNPNFNVNNTPKLIGGYSAECLKIGRNVYETVVDNVITVRSLEVAEMAKLVENTYRFVNISLVNELKVVADRIGLDIFEVIDAAGSKPFGFTKFFPGPGIGGHCIPVDPHYLSWKATGLGLKIRSIDIAAEVNDELPGYVCHKIQQSLSKGSQKLSSARILILGVSYKRDIEDLRESPSLAILDRLIQSGAEVSYADPHVPDLKVWIDGEEVTLTSTELRPDVISKYDVVVLLCDHSSFDYENVLLHANVVVDTRGRYPMSEPKIVRA